MDFLPFTASLPHIHIYEGGTHSGTGTTVIIKLSVTNTPMLGMSVTTSAEVIVDDEEQAFQAGRDYNRLFTAMMNGFATDEDDE